MFWRTLVSTKSILKVLNNLSNNLTDCYVTVMYAIAGVSTLHTDCTVQNCTMWSNFLAPPDSWALACKEYRGLVAVEPNGGSVS